jgi:nitrogen fixation-related uncharacterized protein
MFFATLRRPAELAFSTRSTDCLGQSQQISMLAILISVSFVLVFYFIAILTFVRHVEKQFGDRSGIESTVLGKRRIQYEEELSHESRNYDTWFDYVRLEEGAWRNGDYEGSSEKGLERVRETYERAIAQVPPSAEKRHWRRYMFLWLNYALFEEIDAKVFCFVCFIFGGSGD